MTQVQQIVHFKDHGRIAFSEAWDLQTALHNGMKERKIAARRAELDYATNHHLLFCEHDPVYTLGKSGKMDHLLISDDNLAKKSISFFKINRGGDITYHGPGQITAYPILDLDYFFNDVHKYVRLLEQVVIETLRHYDIMGQRIEGFTGVWIRHNYNYRKICAIGVHLSRWITMHGIALNVNTDLEYFKNIVPCGIAEADMEVTSLANELEKKIDIKEVKIVLKENFSKQFDFSYI